MDTHESQKKGRRPIREYERTGTLVERGEFSRYDLHEACWKYIHSSINESVSSPNPLIQSLAVLSARVGKNRLRRFASRDLHPLTQALLAFRLRAEASAGEPIVAPATPPVDKATVTGPP
jgi:hypothetical protein